MKYNTSRLEGGRVIKTIFLDMDGVITDHHAGLKESFPDWNGVTPIHEHLGLSEDFFWEKMTGMGTRWWGDLPEFPWSKKLVGACEEAVGPENVYILTAPSRTCVATATGKLYWLRNHFPQFPHGGRVMIGNHKWLLAAPDRLLIDDTGKKCYDFAQAGGEFHLFTKGNLARLLRDLSKMADQRSSLRAGDRSSGDSPRPEAPGPYGD